MCPVPTPGHINRERITSHPRFWICPPAQSHCRDRGPSAPLEAPAMAEPPPMTAAQPPVVTLPAEIDMANADDLGKQFAAALTPGVQVIIADMTATTFC